MYDAFEIHPVIELGGVDLQGKRITEVCGPKEAQFWSVYGHLRTGGLECLADVPAQNIAKYVQYALECTYLTKEA